MTSRRLERINSLLKEVLSEVIRNDINNPKLSPLITITQVDVSADLSHAKVYFSVIGAEQSQTDTFKVLTDSSGYISALACRKVVLKRFPGLTFYLDTSLDEQFKIDKILAELRTDGRDPPHQ